MSESPVLRLRNIGKSYTATDDGDQLHVLKDIELSVSAGETVSIVGPSGCGKSTLLNIIGTLDEPTTGEVFLDDENLADLDQTQLAAVRNRKIGFIFQAHHLLPHCTVLENVLVPTIARQGAGDSAAALNRAERLLEKVGLKDRRNHRPGQLSGGERQRVAVVRALINEPRILLADEPTGALDRQSAENLGKLLLELNRDEKVTLVVVTHSLDLAKSMSSTLELRDGRLEPVS